jgi:hypothetical protein
MDRHVVAARSDRQNDGMMMTTTTMMMTRKMEALEVAGNQQRSPFTATKILSQPHHLLHLSVLIRMSAPIISKSSRKTLAPKRNPRSRELDQRQYSPSSAL